MQFRIQAIDARQAVTTLHLDAPGEAEARSVAVARGLTVLSVQPLGWSLAAALRGLRSGFGSFGGATRRRAAFPLALFAVELQALLEAGLNLVEAMQALGARAAGSSSERQRVLEGILSGIRRGETFSQAVSAFPEHFPSLFVATLRASEQTGSLNEALGRYITWQEEVDKVKKKVVSALIYPVILMVVGTLVVAFLMFYVVPRFARVYEDVAVRLPLFSRLLLEAGRAVGEHRSLVAALLAAALALGAWLLSRPALRAWAGRQLWRIPALGDRMKLYQLARLYRTVGMLLRAGLPAVRALDMARDLLSGHLRQSLARARQRIAEGQPMSGALEAAGLATPVGLRMLQVGERSGDMGEIMTRIARFHDEEIARFIDWFTRAFEPLLMTVLGLAVGGVVVLMYMPIFELAGSIQ